MKILGVPVSKPMFGIRWLMTKAQLELLSIDVPITSMKPYKDSGHGRKKGKHEFKTPSKERFKAVENKWKEKYGGKKDTSVTFDLSKFKIREVK